MDEDIYIKHANIVINLKSQIRVLKSEIKQYEKDTARRINRILELEEALEKKESE